MHILVFSMGTKAIGRKAAVHYAAHSLCRGNLKNLMTRSFTYVCQLYCCSSKHNDNKALRITFNSCKTVSRPTSSMALTTVNIDKIIKVTKIKPCYRQIIAFSYYEGYKVYCACAVSRDLCIGGPPKPHVTIS